MTLLSISLTHKIACNKSKYNRQTLIALLAIWLHVKTYSSLYLWFPSFNLNLDVEISWHIWIDASSESVFWAVPQQFDVLQCGLVPSNSSISHLKLTSPTSGTSKTFGSSLNVFLKSSLSSCN